MYKVLIADDESIIRKGLSCIVDWEELGFEIIGEASNGEYTLKFITKNKPDLVLMDVRMPGMYGLEVLRRAREDGYQGEAIILSGYSDFEYTKEAIKLGVCDYLTKPVDEKELEKTLTQVKKNLDAKKASDKSTSIYKTKARETILAELLTGETEEFDLIEKDLGLHSDIYQVIFYEKYSHEMGDVSYNFSELLKVANQKGDVYEFLNMGENHVILLKGHHAVNKLRELLRKYEGELPPEKNSPLDTVFITCGEPVDSLAELPKSYYEANELIRHRFFCDEHQHIMTVKDFPSDLIKNESARPTAESLENYSTELFNYIQSFNRNRLAEILKDLRLYLYSSGLKVEEIQNYLVDLYLRIKEKTDATYPQANIPFKASSEAVNYISKCYYLYEILIFISEEFEMIMSSIGHSSRESVIDDIIYYINHNYTQSITLENIAPLFGYNSSYLGKIFTKKVGINFNTYLDNTRIAHAKELLKTTTMQVYKIAETVGYRNVDYFHIKFKKSTGLSPAEYRHNITEGDEEE